MELKRLNKFIGETGHCSRREADEMIAQQRVTVNGAPAEMGMKVGPEDVIRIDGQLIAHKSGKFVYLALNKPPGIECTTNTSVKDNIVDFVNYPTRIFPIGRLDKASEGLIFLTDDGEIVNKILRARNNHEKEYLVSVDKPISDRFLKRMAAGVPILNTVTRPCEIEATGNKSFRIILTQGLNRQIRRMCEYLGYNVQTLQRVRIMNITLDVPLGRYRELTPEEIEQLNLLISDSDKGAPSGKVAAAETAPAPEKRPAAPIKTRTRPQVGRPDTFEKRPQRDFKKPASPKPEQPRKPQPSAPKREITILKKGDPGYREKGDY